MSSLTKSSGWATVSAPATRRPGTTPWSTLRRVSWVAMPPPGMTRSAVEWVPLEEVLDRPLTPTMVDLVGLLRKYGVRRTADGGQTEGGQMEGPPDRPSAGEVAELLVALVRNACVNDGMSESGHESRSVETLAEALGDPDEVVEAAPGRQSAVWRVPGTVPGAPRLALMGHLDVVPANPEGWSVDPFEGVIHDGFVWGRGAVDMLNLTAAMAAVFGRYRRGDLDALPGDLLFLAVADEENGGGLGADPLVRERWDLVGCEALLTEIAYPALETPGGIAYPVNVGEKGPHWRRLISRGTPGHGSVPYGQDNASDPAGTRHGGNCRGGDAGLDQR